MCSEHVCDACLTLLHFDSYRIVSNKLGNDILEADYFLTQPEFPM